LIFMTKLIVNRVAIFVTFVIYIRAGREIYNKRRLLQNISKPVPRPLPLVEDPFQSMKTTEVHVTSEAIQDGATPIDVNRLGRQLSPSERPQYSVTVSSTLPVNFRIGNMPMFPTKHGLPKLPKSELGPSRQYAAMQANNAAWSYSKVAVLFFTAMLVTWIPSSANRVYSVVHPGTINVPLIFASAFVLPLQGLWNALIYITTSLTACRLMVNWIIGRETVNSSMLTNGFGTARGNRLSSRAGKGDETDSTTELQSRPGTKGSQR